MVERNRNTVKVIDPLGGPERLAHMEYDVRPPEPYDLAVSAIFIVLMLVVIALVVVAA